MWVSCYAEMVPLVKTKAFARQVDVPVDISQKRTKLELQWVVRQLKQLFRLSSSQLF